MKLNTLLFVVFFAGVIGIQSSLPRAARGDDEDLANVDSDEMFTVWKFLILGQVENRTTLPRTDYGSTPVVYRVRVICDYRNRVAAGSIITINGDRGGGGSFTVQTPFMSKGEYFIMPVDPTQDLRTFQYTLQWKPDFTCPVGVWLPSAVAAKDVADLHTALIDYGRTVDKPLSLTEAQGLLANSNYFLWALGATIVAKDAASEADYVQFDHLRSGVPATITYNKDVLSQAPVGAPVFSLRQALWAFHCLTHVVPEQVRPSLAGSVLELSDYLRRYTAAAKEGFVGVP